MLESLGSRPQKPRLRGVSAKRATPRTAASELRPLEGTAPYHHVAAGEVQHFPDDLPTDVQKHNIGREYFVRQSRRVDTWQQALDNENPRAPPYAVGDESPVRELQPAQPSRARTPRQAAGVATLRDAVGAPTLGGVSDFGMLPAPAPRNLPVRPNSKEFVRPVSREPQARGTSTMTPLEGDKIGFGVGPPVFGPPRGADAAFKSPVLRPRSLYETPQMMKQRGLRSAPVSMGFHWPAKMSARGSALAQDQEEAFAKVQTLTEYFPLRSAVLNAQYKVDDASHIC